MEIRGTYGHITSNHADGACNGDLSSKDWLNPILLHVLLPSACSHFWVGMIGCTSKGMKGFAIHPLNTKFPQSRCQTLTHQAQKPGS